MQNEPQSNDDLRAAIPKRVQEDVAAAVSTLPQNPYWFDCFKVSVDDESVSIPYRVYHNPSSVRSEKLNNAQREFVDCILTRHNDGFVRQTHLARILNSKNTWVPPFVVQLLGEYVIEIIEENLGNLDAAIYARFLKSNPDFLALTEQRVFSYWDCYYRSIKKGEYPGFHVLRFFKELASREH